MTTDSEWRSPMPCPECHVAGGRPRSVESKTSAEVVVSIRCAACGHEWRAERPTPYVIPGTARHTTPEEPAQ